MRLIPRIVVVLAIPRAAAVDRLLIVQESPPAKNDQEICL
jgi:hypothetical protein